MSANIEIASGNIEVFTDFKKTIKVLETHNNKKDLILFVSFDLVNSSEYKITNKGSWLKVIIRLIKSIANEMQKNDFNIWRVIGDEIIFTRTITNQEQLKESISITYEVLVKLERKLKNGEIFTDYVQDRSLGEKIFEPEEIEIIIEQGILALKAAAWVALIEKDSNTVKKVDNVAYNFTTAIGQVLEFQGNDIDAGFRVCKECTMERRFALSAELAYILSKDSIYNSRLHVITYKKLKGVWNQRLYPVVWYHDDKMCGQALRDSFYYDEDEKNDIVREYLERQTRNSTHFRDQLLGNAYDELCKVINDRGLVAKVKKMEQRMAKDEEPNVKNYYDTGNSQKIEVHAVAVCFNTSQNRFLMFKRNGERGKWDFGCSKLTSSISFSEQLKKDYKEIFGVDVEIIEPFKEFVHTKGNKFIPGIRYIGVIKNDKEIKLESTKYDKSQYFSIDEFRDLSPDEVLAYDEFLEVLEIAYKRIKYYKEEK